MSEPVPAVNVTEVLLELTRVLRDLLEKMTWAKTTVQFNMAAAEAHEVIENVVRALT